MKFIRPEKIFAMLVLATWLFAMIHPAFSQVKESVVSSAEHQQLLNEYKAKAEAFCAKNLNRFGLEELKKYDKALDSLPLKEKQDTLAAIEKAYTEKNSHRKSVTDSLKVKSALLSQQKEASLLKYHGLLRKAAITFVIWLAAVLLLLKFRNRSVKKSQLSLDANLAQLNASEQSFAQSKDLFQSATGWQKKIAAIHVAITELKNSMSKLGEKISPEISQGEQYKSLLKNSEAVQARADRIGSFANIILSQHDEEAREKQLININQLSDSYADLAYSGMMQEDGSFSCQLSKDFEKNLPSIRVVPDDAGMMLLYILSNAFNSVREKQKMLIKGYVGKVSISTRILPRFVQIRVKDNGIGIPDQAMELIYDPFHSTQPVGEGAGLGLFFSRQIITENGGEIKIESDHENATDVYIKFFLKT